MTDPQNPHDPLNQQSDNQRWGQESASQTEGQQWNPQSATPSESQPWGQQSASQPESQPWAQQSASQPESQPWGGEQAADPNAGQQQWGGQYGGQAHGQPIDPSANQWNQQQADPYAAQYAQQGAWAGAQAQQPGMIPTGGKSFFSALFDFNFTSFVTPKIIKAVYIVLTAFIGLGVVFFIISALVSGEPLIIIGALILGPLIGLIYLALSRMSLELYYAVIRLSEDVNARLPRQ